MTSLVNWLSVGAVTSSLPWHGGSSSTSVSSLGFDTDGVVGDKELAGKGGVLYTIEPRDTPPTDSHACGCKHGRQLTGE